MGTSIGVQESTRDALVHVKRELGLGSLDEAVVVLLRDHQAMQARRESEAVRERLRAQRERLAAFCRQHGIRRLAVFGSVLHGEAAVGSDLDLLVEFVPGREPGLIGRARMEQTLSDLLGKQVDLSTAGDLSPYFRDEVLREAVDVTA